MDNVESRSAGIDWLTLTLPSNAVLADQWVEHALTVLDRIVEQGYELRYRTLQGYYGVSAGNCFVGSREDGHIVQLTGHHANDHFVEVWRPACHCSRLDVQCTIKYRDMPQDVAKECYEHATLDNLRLPVTRRRKLTIISSSGGGDTFYLGSHSSDQFARIYNKAVQSEDISYERSWRFELVYKNDMATRLAVRCPYNSVERADWATSVVYQWLKARGVTYSGLTADERSVLPLSRTLPTDVEKRMQWLRKQVKPTVMKLVAAGFGPQVAELFAELDKFRET